MSKPTFPSRLLFLPGALGNRNFWEPLALELSNRAERVFMAYPGFGDAPAEPSFSCLEDLVNDVVSRIDRPTALIAQSMGGVIAVKAALRKQDFITHLVLVATSAGIDTAKLGAVDWREEFKRKNPHLPDWFASFRSDLTSQLKTIEVPVLLLWGDCDPLSPVAVGRCLMSHFPDADLHIVPGGEHDLAHRYPHLIAPLIEMHLARRNRISIARIQTLENSRFDY
jgi:pimeloyl-ACP methyl ester carboxylesterase